MIDDQEGQTDQNCHTDKTEILFVEARLVRPPGTVNFLKFVMVTLIIKGCDLAY